MLQVTHTPPAVELGAGAQARPALSVVVPMCNEENSVHPLVRELVAVLEGIGVTYEIVLVDDGSRDATWERIARLAAESPAVIGVSLSRNFGHQRALLAGLQLAHGQAVVSMDGDLQHPPELIPSLYELWRQGYKVVNTQRRDEEVASRFKRFTSRYFYKLFSILAEVPMAEGNSDFRLLDRTAVDALVNLKAAELFLRGAVQWLGFPATVVSFRPERRLHGSSKYTLRKMLSFAGDAIISFSTKPLRIGIWLGIATSFLAFVEIAYVLARYFRGETVSGWASTVGILSFLFGVLFIILGIIGSYLAWIHQSLQNRPTVIIRDSVNLPRT
ncbi:MAG: glycosyltransferase family 2 protein [Gammaproteobacteria bacterium]